MLRRFAVGDAWNLEGCGGGASGWVGVSGRCAGGGSEMIASCFAWERCH